MKSFEKVLVYVTLLNYENVKFLFTSSQDFHVISKYQKAREVTYWGIFVMRKRVIECFVCVFCWFVDGLGVRVCCW